MGVILDVVQASQRVSAGKIARGESEVAAKQEELASVTRERDRKSRLADAMASQNASAAAGGIAAFEGSPLTILNEDIRREEVATTRDLFQSQLAQMTIRARGVIAQRQATAGATIGLIRSIEDRATKAAGA